MRALAEGKGSIMSKLSKQYLAEGAFSRRSFVTAAAGLGLGATLLSVAGCSGNGDGGAGSATAGSGAASTGSDSDTIRFGCDISYAPYEWRQDSETEYTLPIDNVPGTYCDGYDIQLMKMIGDKLGKTPVVINMAFNGLITALKEGQVDAICSGMSATDERKQSVDFSNPYLSSGVAIMVPKDSKYANATSLEDFKGANVLGQKGSLPDSVIDQIPDVNHLDPVDSIPDSIARLLQGTVDAVVVDANNKDIYESKYPDYTVIVFEDGKGFDTPGVDPCVAVQKDDPEGILDAINEVIDSLSDDERQDMWNECSERAPE